MAQSIAAIESHGVKPLSEAINTLGGWPVVMDNLWDNSSFDWIEVTASMRKMGFLTDMFAQFKVLTDSRNNTKNILYVRYI